MSFAFLFVVVCLLLILILRAGVDGGWLRRNGLFARVNRVVSLFCRGGKTLPGGDAAA